MKTNFMSECAAAASLVLQYKNNGDHNNAGIILCCEAERIGQEHNCSYSAAKESIGVFLRVAA